MKQLFLYIAFLVLGGLLSGVISAALGLGNYEPFNVVKQWLHFQLSPPIELLQATGGGILVCLAVLLIPVDKKNKYGSAKWATRSDAKKMELLGNRGIILAKAFGKYLRFSKNLSAIVLAPPGTGKTAGVIIPTLFSCGNSMMIFDVKGELYSLTSKARSKFSKVLRFAPTESDSIHWNPLDKSILPDEWRDIVQVVERIVAVLIPVKDESDHWNLEARSCFMFFTLYLIHKNGGGTSLPEVRALTLSIPQPQEWIEELLAENDSLPIRVIEEGNSLVGKADKEFSGVFSSLKKAFNVFGDERIADATSSNDFTPEQLRKQKLTLYIEVKAIDIDRLAPLVRLMIESTALYLLTVAPEQGQLGIFKKISNLLGITKHAQKTRDQDVTFVLDEFIRLGKMPVIIKNPALSRGNRFNTIFVAQDWGQVKDLYGENGVSELITTTAYKVVFQQNNQDTAERVSKSIGDKTQDKSSKSTSRSGVSKSESQEAARLIRAQEITDLDKDKCLVLTQGFMSRPIMADICYWFKDPKMKNLAGSL